MLSCVKEGKKEETELLILHSGPLSCFYAFKTRHTEVAERLKSSSVTTVEE